MIEILQFVAPPSGTQAAGTAADAGDSPALDFSLLLGAEMGRGQETAVPPALMPVDASQPGDAATPETTDTSGDPAAILNAIAAAQLPVDPQQIAALPAPPASQLPILPAVMAAAPATPQSPMESSARTLRGGQRISVVAEDARGSPKAPATDATPAKFDFAAVALRQATAPEQGAAGDLRAEIGAKSIPESQAASHLLLSHQPQHAVREAATPRIEQLPQQVGTPAWNEGFADRVTWMAKNDIQTAELRLNPADLGPIDVTLTLSGDDKSQATVQFSAAHAGTREAIESALPRLREMMLESGINLGQASVDANNSQAADGGDRRQQGGNQPGRPAAQPEAGSATIAAGSRSIGRGLVDTFA